LRSKALRAKELNSVRPIGRIEGRSFDYTRLIQNDSVGALASGREPSFSDWAPPISDATQSGELFEYRVREACRVPVGRRLLFGWMIVNYPRQITARAVPSLS